MLGHRGYDVNSGFPSLSIEVVIAASSYEGIGVLLRFDAEHSEGSGCPTRHEGCMGTSAGTAESLIRLGLVKDGQRSSLPRHRTAMPRRVNQRRPVSTDSPGDGALRVGALRPGLDAAENTLDKPAGAIRCMLVLSWCGTS